MRGLKHPEGQAVDGNAYLDVEVACRSDMHAAVAGGAAARRHGGGFVAAHFGGGAVGKKKRSGFSEK
jgi:hypothetical protein